MDREELIKLIQNEVMTAAEVVEYLETTKQNLASLKKRGKLVPVKEYGLVKLYLRADVEKRKEDAVELNEKFRPYDKETGL
ncbi:DNA-binding protein [Paenibacillus alba]|uniref:DNA-binding protein n=1 Tax=Paenibacillus alba TaxID=1197127 RepID=A0ABU6GAV0_9BACL|nr:DNA-binding protein [Paenibacillus alba]MEC0231266.1 DNA-binding protein [Paenibacillus alba]